MSNPMNLKPGRILNFSSLPAGIGLSAGLYSGMAANGLPQYTCPCGSPASNVCENNLLCSGCFFKYSVAKAAGRLEEFWDAQAAVARQKIQDYYAQMQQNVNPNYSDQAQSQTADWVQKMQNFYPGALIPVDDPSGSVQTPEDYPNPVSKGWWKKFAEWRAKQK
jgi:hypothetical protein